MTLLYRLASVLAWLFQRSSAERHLDDELETFVQMSAAAKMQDGHEPAEARRLAILELGGVEQVKEQVRTGRHGALLDDLGKDVRYALRMIAIHRSVAAIVVLTLALGIGANTAIFSIVDNLLLRTLPVRDPDRLAVLVAGGPSGQTSWTYPIWEQIQQRADLFDGAFAWSTFDAQFDLSVGGETRLVSGVWASANAFSTLGVTAALGRTFAADDDVRGGGGRGPVAVISHAFWQRHFGAAPDVVGRTLTLERIPFTIVGVTPAGFYGLSAGRSYDVAIPFGVEPLLRGAKESRLDRRTSWWLSIMVRLEPGQTIPDATTTLRGRQPQIREATLPPQLTAASADEYLEDPFTLVQATTARSGLQRRYQRPLTVIMVVVALVLLIACANIANLLLARATARAHEWSVRLALGASRGRLARQLLTESSMLALMGAGAGLVVAQWASRLLVAQLSSESVVLDLRLDWRVLAFTATVSMVAALVFGIAPALRATRCAPIDAMKGRGRNVAGGRVAAASGLVVFQVILSVVLVVCAGLFLRTFSSLVHVPLGFDRDRLLLVDIDTRRSGIAPEALAPTYDRVRDRVQAVPGVDAAGVSLVTPLGGALWSRRVEVSGSPLVGAERIDGPEGFGFTDAPIPESSPLALFNAVTPGWMSTYGTTILSGRDIAESDRRGAAGVALVNRAFARKFLNGANPVGHTVRTTRPGETATRQIIGLVADAVYRGIRDPLLPTVYVPLAQYDANAAVTAPAEVTLSIRTSQPPAALTKSVAAAIAEAGPTLALTIRPLADQVNDSLTQERLLSLLSACFGALALLMAAVGLYGVTSYAVTLRRTEIGIRLALGATRGAVMRLVLGRVSTLVGAGIVLGLVLGVWASRFVAVLLFGLEPGDPATLVAAGAALAGIGLGAGWLPARRASRLDPRRVLSEI